MSVLTPTPTTPKIHTGTADLKLGFSPQADLVRRWESFRELLDHMSVGQILDVIERGPSSLAQYVHFLSGGGL